MDIQGVLLHLPSANTSPHCYAHSAFPQPHGQHGDRLHRHQHDGGHSHRGYWVKAIKDAGVGPPSNYFRVEP